MQMQMDDLESLQRELAELDATLADRREFEDRLSNVVEGGELDDEARHDLDQFGGDRERLNEEYETRLFRMLTDTERLEEQRADLVRQLRRLARAVEMAR